MKKTKIQKNIILITLLITIIIIVSIVSIQFFIDEGIVIDEKEKIALSTSEAYLKGGGIITKENLQIALETNLGAEKYSIDSSNSKYFKVTLTESGRKYKIYTNAKLKGPF